MMLEKPRAMRAAMGLRAVRRGCVFGLIAGLGWSGPVAAATREPPETQEPPASAPPPTSEEPAPTGSSPSPPPSSQAEPEPVQGASRIIKDHTFIFPSYVGSPIVATYLGLRIRLGDSSVPGLPTEVGTRDLSAVTLKEGLDVGVKITDWLGLFATGGVRSLIGTNLGSQVYQGSNYDFGGYGGAIFRVLDIKSTGTQLALRAAAGYTSGRFVSLYPIFDHPIMSIVDAFQGNLRETIKTPFSTFEYNGGLAFAQSIHRLLGVQAFAGIGGTSVNLQPFNGTQNVRESSTITGFTFALGVAPSIDFNAFKVPLAVMPEYLMAKTATSDQVRGAGDFDTRHQFVVGVYYSGRTDLQLGLSWMTILGIRPLSSPQGTSQTPSQQEGDLILRYIW